jgi:glutathione S-transferase
MNARLPRLYDYPASGNCYKVRLLLAHLGLRYERLTVDIFNGETLTDRYARINAMRTTPVLETVDGDLIPESNAILVYLAHGTRFLPQEPFELAGVIRWLILEQTDVVPMIGGLRFRLLTGRLEPDDPEVMRRHRAGGEILSMLDRHLSGTEFFVGGRYTIADIAIYGYVHVAEQAGFDLDRHRELRAWLDRVRRQPGYMDDLRPYGDNARPGAGSRSVAD